MSNEERVTLADLEVYGLSPRAAGCLEKWFGVLYVDEVEYFSRWMFRGHRGVGTGVWRELRRSLGNFRAGLVVKSVEECVYGCR